MQFMYVYIVFYYFLVESTCVYLLCKNFPFVYPGNSASIGCYSYFVSNTVREAVSRDRRVLH